MKDSNKTLSLILAKVKPGMGAKADMGGEHEEEEMPNGDLEMIAEELISAVRDGNTKGVVEALRGAFLTLDAQPHVEGEHVEEEGEEEEEAEGEGEEHEAAESAGFKAGEKYGGKELFKKYFGGGKASRYADGGEVKKKYSSGTIDEGTVRSSHGDNMKNKYSSGMIDEGAMRLSQVDDVKKKYSSGSIDEGTKRRSLR